MQRRSIVLMMALSVMLAAPVMAQRVKIHYEQNFDKLKDGDIDGQDGWATGAPANMASTVVTSDVNHGPGKGKAMEVNANQEVIRNFDPKITSGVHFFSIWFRMENPSAQNTLHIYIGDEVREWSAGPVLRIGSQSGGDFRQIGVHNGNTREPLGEIKQGEWQHIFEVINVDDQTYSVFLDDELIADGFSWRNPANHKALGWLMLGFDGGVGLIGYYDDIVFGEGDTLPLAVSPEGRLATAWGELKVAR